MHRIKLLTDIARQLNTIIPAERGYKMREDSPVYLADPTPDDSLLATVPMP